MKRYATLFRTPLDASGFKIVNIPWVGWEMERESSLVCDEENKKLIVDNNGNINITDASVYISVYIDNVYTTLDLNLTFSLQGYTELYSKSTYDSSKESLPSINTVTTYPINGNNYYTTCEDTYIRTVTVQVNLETITYNLTDSISLYDSANFPNHYIIASQLTEGGQYYRYPYYARYELVQHERDLNNFDLENYVMTLGFAVILQYCKNQGISYEQFLQSTLYHLNQFYSTYHEEYGYPVLISFVCKQAESGISIQIRNTIDDTIIQYGLYDANDNRIESRLQADLSDFTIERFIAAIGGWENRCRMDYIYD